MQRQSDGQSTVPSLMPHGCLHQRTNLVHHLQEQILSNHNLFIRHIRYVDNRLIFGDKRLLDLSPYEVLLDDGFYGKPIILEKRNLTKSFLASCSRPSHWN